MARYPLILKDKTYMALLQYGAQKNKTLGKLINEILNDFVRQIPVAGQVPLQRVCVVCGEKASIVAYGKGQQKFFVCTHHKGLARKIGAYKEIQK